MHACMHPLPRNPSPIQSRCTHTRTAWHSSQPYPRRSLPGCAGNVNPNCVATGSTTDVSGVPSKTRIAQPVSLSLSIACPPLAALLSRLEGQHPQPIGCGRGNGGRGSAEVVLAFAAAAQPRGARQHPAHPRLLCVQELESVVAELFPPDEFELRKRLTDPSGAPLAQARWGRRFCGTCSELLSTGSASPMLIQTAGGEYRLFAFKSAFGNDLTEWVVRRSG